MAMASTSMASISNIEESIEDHDEDEGPLLISKLEVKLISIIHLVVLSRIINLIIYVCCITVY